MTYRKMPRENRTQTGECAGTRMPSAIAAEVGGQKTDESGRAFVRPMQDLGPPLAVGTEVERVWALLGSNQ